MLLKEEPSEITPSTMDGRAICTDELEFRNPTCSLCDVAIDNGSLTLFLKSNEVKEICPDCMWKALLGGYTRYDKRIAQLYDSSIETKNEEEE